jgi:hypothetical protein
MKLLNFTQFINEKVETNQYFYKKKKELEKLEEELDGLKDASSKSDKKKVSDLEDQIKKLKREIKNPYALRH